MVVIGGGVVGQGSVEDFRGWMCSSSKRRMLLEGSFGPTGLEVGRSGRPIEPRLGAIRRMDDVALRS